MAVSELRQQKSDPTAPASHLTLREIAPQLRQMLADEDWLPACQDTKSLNELLKRIESEPDIGDEAAPADVALLVAAHQDFGRFRKALAARLNAPDDKPLHITPDEWLYMRLHSGDKADSRPPYARYRPDREEERFRIGD